MSGTPRSAHSRGLAVSSRSRAPDWCRIAQISLWNNLEPLRFLFNIKAHDIWLALMCEAVLCRRLLGTAVPWRILSGVLSPAAVRQASSFGGTNQAKRGIFRSVFIGAANENSACCSSMRKQISHDSGFLSVTTKPTCWCLQATATAMLAEARSTQ